jgi:hypothetical protein
MCRNLKHIVYLLLLSKAARVSMARATRQSRMRSLRQNRRRSQLTHTDLTGAVILACMAVAAGEP